jgi:hypothetical protein
MISIHGVKSQGVIAAAQLGPIEVMVSGQAQIFIFDIGSS